MDWRKHVRSQLPPLDVSPSRENDIVEELAVQLESIYERARASGCDHAEAFSRATAEVPDWQSLAVTLAGIERAPRRPVELDRPVFWSGLAVDARHALRSILTWKASAAALGMLSLSVAAALMVALVIESWMRPLPFNESGRLAIVWGTNHTVGQARDVVSGPTFTDWQRQTSSFEGMAAFAQGSLAVRRDNQTGSVDTLLVTPDFFAITGIRAHIGRLFSRPDAGTNRVVLSYEFWQSQFGGDPGVAGRTLRDLNLPHEVIGVLPPGFRLLSNPDAVTVLDPQSLEREARTFYYYWVVARLRDGVTFASAQHDLDGVMQRLSSQHPVMKGWSATVESLTATINEPVRPSVMVLFTIASLVLLVGAGNTVNLVASRALNRRREMAVRTALGASAVRVRRQWLFEGLLLSCASTGMALAIAVVAIAMFSAVAPTSAAIAGSAATVDLPPLQLTPSVATGAALVALALGVILGAAPWRSLSFDDLRGAFTTAPVTLSYGRQSLLTGQAAIATMLTVVAGLLLMLVLRLAATSPGFDPERVTAFMVGSLHDFDTAQRARYYRELLDAVRTQPGVSAVALNDYVPLTNEDDYEGLEIPGRRRDGMPLPREEWRRVSAGYFETLAIPLINGRYLSATDDERSASVVVINAAMAGKYWPDENPVGARIRITNRAYEWSEIVGVVGDVRETGLDRPAKPMMFVPLQRDPRPEMGLFVRASGDSATTRAAIRHAIQMVDPSRPILESRAMQQIVRDSYSVQRAVLSVAATLAILALLLIAGGTYAVVSLVTRARQHEMGIRISLGARPADVAAAVLSAPCAAAAFGIAAGLAATLPALTLVRSRITGLQGIDLSTAGFAAVTVAFVVVLACALPAIQAMRTDPAITLKSE